MRTDVFLRLPPPTALLLLSSILDLTSGHAIYRLPRETDSSDLPSKTTLSHHVLNVVPFPPPPTDPPDFESDLRRRQPFNTICGWLGGNPDLPATCSAGSHCVLDAEHGAVGCCPDGQLLCTTGVFTGCVDDNSPPQTEVNPYVYTCAGSNVCYRNQFDGGYFQFGCGTASSLATMVFSTASGLIATTLSRPSLFVSFTATPSSLKTPTIRTKISAPSSTSGTMMSSSLRMSSISGTTTTTTRSSSSGSSSTSGTTTTSSSSSSSSSSSTTSSTRSNSPTSSLPTSEASATSTDAPATNDNPSVDRTGAIVGGTISGVAILIALIVLGIYLWRRRRFGNERRGPVGGSTQFIGPVHGPGGGPGFAPLHQSHEGWETGLTPGTAAQLSSGDLYPGHPGREPIHPPIGAGYHSPGHYPAAYAGQGASSSATATGAVGAGLGAVGAAAATGRRPSGEHDVDDQVPLTREIDDFSRGFHDALGRIGEEDEYASSGNRAKGGNGAGGPHDTGMGPGGDDEAAGSGHGGGRPLWQQNRRQSRNLMWM